MTSFELTNGQRRYFGLNQIFDNWFRQSLSETTTVYFEGDKIVKILDFSYGYLEYDTNINTTNKQILLPKTARGKEQKLTVSKILKVKGSGIQLSASFLGGGISVYDNKRNLFFIKSFPEEGGISTYEDIKNWVRKYISESPSNYFEWLIKELNSERKNNKIKQGDIIAFPVARYEYGFASIVLNNFENEHVLLSGEIFKFNLFSKPLMILPYSFTSRTLDINFDELVKKPTLKPIEISDTGVFYGEFPIVSFKKLDYAFLEEFDLASLSKYLTIPYTKTDLVEKNNRW